MTRLVLIGALFAAAGGCGEPDDRPRTLAYITDTILAPTCASAQCHSAFKRQVGDQFDTADAARQSIVVNSLVDVSDPPSSILYQSITVGSTSLLDPRSGTKVRMPYDAPMPDADVALILHWIEDGAEGAQCLANDQGRGCTATTVGATTTYQVVDCMNGNATSVVTVCAPNQVCSLITGNGQCVTL